MGRKRKHMDRYSRILTDALPGRTVGGSYAEGVITRVDPRDKAGHLYVWVRWLCCNVEKRHRYDKLMRNEIKSCGCLKRKLYAKHVQNMTEHPYLNAEGQPVDATARLKPVKPAS